jgi:hypothetical protein
MIKIKSITTNIDSYPANIMYESYNRYIMDSYINQWSDIDITLIEVRNGLNVVLIVRI